MSAPRPSTPSWFARHKIATALAALLLLGCCAQNIFDTATNSDKRSVDKPAEPDWPKRSESAPTRERPGGRHSQTYLVTDVIDGDTVQLRGGPVVRLVGIDAPERGECGHREATVRMGRLVLGKRVKLTTSDDNRDAYGRLLRYVTVGDRDAGLALIEAGLAVARYDSRDGYGRHPRQQRYIAADKAAPDKTCPPPAPPEPTGDTAART